MSSKQKSVARMHRELENIFARVHDLRTRYTKAGETEKANVASRFIGLSKNIEIKLEAEMFSAGKSKEKGFANMIGQIPDFLRADYEKMVGAEVKI
jgi:hypothetical protein